MQGLVRVCARVSVMVAIGVFLSLPATPAWGALGGDITSVQSDAVHMKGSVRTTVATNHTIHQITTDSGTVVREYISPQGKVFAVTWDGPTLPDLQQLLGKYFDQFQQTVQSRPRRVRGPAVVESPGLVVQSAGRMRSFTGRAYLPDSLPQGIDPKALQ